MHYKGGMKIYTKTGDAGDTGLFGGQRVSKADARVEAYGLIDELNAALGMARAARTPSSVDSGLQRIQAELFSVGAELATPESHRDRLQMPVVGSAQVSELESAIDEAESELPPLTSFVLPGGSAAASALHFARTVCRRAERSLVAARELVVVRAELLVYVNRLSDLLFVWARLSNHHAGVPDVPWAPRQR